MKEYLALLFGVGLISGIVRVLAPEGTSKKHVELLCSLCVLAAIAIPAARLIIDADGIEGIFELDGEYARSDYAQIYEDYLLAGNIETSEQILVAELATRLSVSAESISVELQAEKGETGVEVTAALVRLGKSALAADPALITSYIKERTGVECVIVYD